MFLYQSKCFDKLEKEHKAIDTFNIILSPWIIYSSESSAFFKIS